MSEVTASSVSYFIENAIGQRKATIYLSERKQSTKTKENSNGITPEYIQRLREQYPNLNIHCYFEEAKGE